LPCAWQQFGRCTVKYLSLVRANGGTNQPLNPARRWRLDQSAAIPLMQAARLKMHHALSYADAFAVATAQAYAGTLLTGDPELLQLTGIVALEALHRSAR